MIRRIRRAAEWVADLADKAKAIAAAVSTFTAVVVAATADDALSTDEWPTLVTAGVALATAVYAIVWGVPNKGFVALRDLPKDALRVAGKGREPE